MVFSPRKIKVTASSFGGDGGGNVGVIYKLASTLKTYAPNLSKLNFTIIPIIITFGVLKKSLPFISKVKKTCEKKMELT